MHEASPTSIRPAGYAAAPKRLAAKKARVRYRGRTRASGSFRIADYAVLGEHALPLPNVDFVRAAGFGGPASHQTRSRVDNMSRCVPSGSTPARFVVDAVKAKIAALIDYGFSSIDRAGIDIGAKIVARYAVQLFSANDVRYRYAAHLNHLPDCSLAAAKISRQLLLRSRLAKAGHQCFVRGNFRCHDQLSTTKVVRVSTTKIPCLATTVVLEVHGLCR